jgi:hypothetical protein
MFGREQRKLLSQGIAFIGFKWVVSFGLIAYAVSGLPPSIASAVVVLLLAIDLAAGSTTRAIQLFLSEPRGLVLPAHEPHLLRSFF